MKASPKTHISRRHACLLLALAAVPASALSLSNFQAITSASIPLTCILTYDQQLPNCALGDFTQQQQNAGNTCSAACRSGIALAQQTIKTSCSGIDTSLSSSVLGVALTGDLVKLLCGGTDSLTSTSATTTATTATKATNSNGNGVATSSTSTSTANTNMFLAPTLNPAVTSTLVQSTRTTAETTTSIRIKTGNAALLFPTTATDAVPKATQLSDSQVRGGGSPFDAQVDNGAQRLGPSIAAIAVGIAAFMLR